MRRFILTSILILFLVAAYDRGYAADRETERLTVAELFRLTARALESEHAPVDAVLNTRLLTAIAIVESGGDTQAVGDSGAAVGLFQFHRAAWFDCFQGAACPKGSKVSPLPLRTNAKASAVAAVRFLRWGERRLVRAGKPVTIRTLAMFHNAGNVGGLNKVYGERVAKVYARIAGGK